MDYEKKYNEAIKRAKQHCADYVVETIFPELKESEGEKIRKALIKLVKKAGEGYENVIDGVSIENAISWLEKQDKQQDVSIQINPSEYINDMGGNGCYLKNTTQASAWSEEDKRHLDTITSLLDDRKKEQSDWGVEVLNEEINWLKSLKDRYAWKPSDEQMEALEHFVRSIGESGYASPYDNNTKLLYLLLEQLKKLREE